MIYSKYVCLYQIEGAFMQGLGLFTMEELKFSPSGVLYTRGPGQYKIPAFCDVPLKFNVYLLANSSNPHAIYSSKVTDKLSLFLHFSSKSVSFRCDGLRLHPIFVCIEFSIISGDRRAVSVPGQFCIPCDQRCRCCRP